MPDVAATAAPPGHAFQLKSTAGAGNAIWLFAIAAVGLGLQLATFPNHDVAWVLWGTREMLAGAVFGRDIIEPNPPLVWYLSMPSTWLATRLGLPIGPAFQVAVALCALASVVLFERILARGSERGAASFVPALVAALFAFVLVGRDFGQREYLMLIAVLPYLALVVARLRGESVATPAAVAIGVAAALGLALKPYFLAVPFLVEVTALLLTRRWSFAFRPETWSMAAVFVAYAGSILLHPDYLSNAMPLARQIYWSFDVSLWEVLLPLALPSVAALFAAVVAIPERRSLPLVMAAAVGGFAISCIVQHKGYSYHVLPVMAGAALAVSALLTEPGVCRRRRIVCAGTLAAILAVASAGTLEWWKLNSPAGKRTTQVHRFLQIIDGHAPNGKFLAVSVHPYPAFPTAIETDAGYASRTNSQWFLPAVVQLREANSSTSAEPLRLAEQRAREFILHDIAQRPGVVIIDTNSQRHTNGSATFDFLAFYLEDPQFRIAWAAYQERERVGTFRVFVRSGESR